MEVKKVKKLFLAIFLLIFTNLSPFMHNVSVFKNKNGNSVYLLADVHYGSSPEIKHPKYSNSYLNKTHGNQAKNLVKFIKKQEPKKSLVLVEDIFDCPLKNEQIQKILNDSKENRTKNNCGTSLGKINELCKKENINIKNLEFRYADTFFNTEIKPAGCFLEESNTIIKELKACNNTILKNHYEKTLNKLNKKNKKLIQIIKKNKNQYRDTISENANNIIDEHCHGFTSKLFDLKILNEIYLNQNKYSNIFVCAGGYHNFRIEKILNELGFNKINSYGEYPKAFNKNIDYSTEGYTEELNSQLAQLKPLDINTFKG